MKTNGIERSMIEAKPPPPREQICALLIDDDQDDVSMIDKLSRKSKQLDITLTTCRSVDDALAALTAKKFDVVYVDYWLGLGTSIPFIHGLAHQNQTPCILLTSLDHQQIDTAIKALEELGAHCDCEVLQALREPPMCVLWHNPPAR